MKINYFAITSSITLYWDKPDNYGPNTLYKIYVDGVKKGETSKTHFTVSGLESEQKYNIEVKTDFENSSAFIITNKKKCILDITKSPYFAVGDCKTLNTKVLQNAIDNCAENEVLYLPKGVYMTGALRLHSNMEIYLEDGAVLQGTDNPTTISREFGADLRAWSLSNHITTRISDFALYL